MQPTPVFLPGESQGWWSLVGCRLWGRTESDTTEATAAAAAVHTDIIKLLNKQTTGEKIYIFLQIIPSNICILLPPSFNLHPFFTLTTGRHVLSMDCT